jgi:uncharacterized surface protein with fasciclin (FAS1) repeats
MKTTKFLMLALTLFLGIISFSSCGEDEPVIVKTNKFWDVVNTNADFSTLKAVIEKAKLTATIQGLTKGTIFAPNNAAFIKSGIDLNTVDEATAAAVIKYHLLGETVNAAAVTTGAVATAQGSNIYPVKDATGNVSINGFKVTTADIPVDNGIIHIIDNVLLPPSKTLLEVAQGSDFTLLVEAISKAGLVSTVSGATAAAPLTVLAPNNAAFAASNITSATIAGLSQANASGIITLHVLPGARVFSTQLAAGNVATAAGANTLSVQVAPAPGFKSAKNTTGGFALVRTSKQGNNGTFDIVCTNGVIHVIDKVITP